ncbi:MAG: ORF6C domain-containing protein [Clostridia bacterium]|nr:ORF6C domain-containing protein [Clostridia bacterium]
MGELTTRENTALSPETVEVVSVVVRDIMAPLMESIGKMLKHNTEAMEQIAAAQTLTSQRIADLEKRVRLQTPMTKTQEKYIGDAIRARARELLDAKGYADDKKAVTKLSGAIRKSVLTRWGVSSLREAPAYDYETALKQIGMWSDFMAIRDVTKEARKRAEMAMVPTEQPAGMDGQEALARPDDQPGKPNMREDMEG